MSQSHSNTLGIPMLVGQWGPLLNVPSHLGQLGSLQPHLKTAASLIDIGFARPFLRVITSLLSFCNFPYSGLQQIYSIYSNTTSSCRRVQSIHLVHIVASYTHLTASHQKRVTPHSPTASSHPPYQHHVYPPLHPTCQSANPPPY